MLAARQCDDQLVGRVRQAHGKDRLVGVLCTDTGVEGGEIAGVLAYGQVGVDTWGLSEVTDLTAQLGRASAVPEYLDTARTRLLGSDDGSEQCRLAAAAWAYQASDAAVGHGSAHRVQHRLAAPRYHKVFDLDGGSSTSGRCVIDHKRALLTEFIVR